MQANVFTADQLHNAFEIFNEHSSQLECSYFSLQEKVESLTAQLKRARSARVHELVRKERLSQRLSLLIETLPGAIVVIDGDGVIQEHNSEAMNLLGQPLTGCVWADVVHREVGDGSSEDGNFQLRDGRWLSLSRRPFGDLAGEILLLADVTEHRQMAQLRQRKERLTLIGETTAEFAHQVRTPLASAVLYASQLKPNSDSQQRVVGKITERLNDLGRMVDGLLGFAVGGQRSDEVVDARILFSGISNTLQEQLDPSTELELLIEGTSISGSHEDQLAFEFVANEDALKGALINLILNADQASEGDTRIQLDAWKDDKTVIFTVTDDGPGIADEVIPRLFDPFYTTRPQGTGLGLAIVHAVATAHGGDVRVDVLNQGTRFTLSLPVVAAADKGGSDV